MMRGLLGVSVAMVFVVEELITESQHGVSADFATIGAMVFTLMMILDVELG